VSAESSPTTDPFDVLFQRVWVRLMYLLLCVVSTTVSWLVLGPSHPWRGVIVVWGTMSIVPAVPGPAIVRCLPRRWFRVPKGERLIHRLLGVPVFGWLLDVSGWNRRVLEPLRGFSGKRAGLLSLEQSVQASTITHGICFAIHVLLAVLAFFSLHPWIGALWVLSPGVVVHLYPVLLQRSTMLRLQPLLHQMGPADCVGC
jgi:Glycosyl-4,4'-diaponeurosporenoate acyltransferase